LTRVEFGGGLYADDLSQRKSYAPMETTSLEELTRVIGARWLKNTRQESNAIIIYVTLDLENGQAQRFLEQAEKHIDAKDIKKAEAALAQMSDLAIKIDESVSAVIVARDYMVLANNYIRAGNFYGARYSLEKAAVYLEKVQGEDAYKAHYEDIDALNESIDDLQSAFAKLDADQIKDTQEQLKQWREQLSSWAAE
jgi:hypothetical protein